VAFLKILRQTKALSVIYPEIDALYGIPQSAKMHPEVDTGIHVELVLWQAARLSGLAEVRFAALVHDLGKAVTPKAELPKHAGHGEKGLPILRSLCDRLKVPNKYRELAELVMRKHITCHQIADKSAQKILNFIDESDAFRRPERFRQMLMVCEADSRGRLGFEHVDYEPRSLLEEAFYAVDFINAKDVLKDLNIEADEIKKALFDARLSEVEKVKQRRAKKGSDT
jgi:tRNA nucleotidyltransferase (CCA-adding enzyme)